MVRVLHYIGLLQFGGSQSFVMEIYRKIDRSKLQFDFVTFPNEKSGFYDEIRNMGGKVFEAPQYNGKNHFEFVKWWNNFFDEHPEYKIVHLHVRSVATICIRIAHKYGCYAIAHSHSTSNGSGVAAMVKGVMQLPIRFQADYLFACSDIAGKWLYGSNVGRSKKYKVIKNAIDAKRFDFDREMRVAVRKSLHVEDKLVIGHVGRMTEAKNHFFLIDVFAEVIKKNENAVLLLIGDGELKGDIENKIAKEGLNNKIILLGSKNDTEKYYQAMDIFVFPSLWEGLGIVAIEAQASGLPCVVSDTIPKEIDINAGLIHVLKLSDESEKWAQMINSIDTVNRVGRFEEVKQSGYDVTENAKKMQRFYLKIAKRRGK